MSRSRIRSDKLVASRKARFEVLEERCLLSYVTDPPSQVSSPAPDTYVLHKELYGFRNYGVADGRADVLYSGESGAWTFDLARIPGYAGSQVEQAEFTISGVLDDHYDVSTESYVGTVTTNGTLQFSGNFPYQHGSPYGTRFSNWTDHEVLAGESAAGAYTIAISNGSAISSAHWIAMDYIELEVTLSLIATIDIKPGSDSNSINLKSNGKLRAGRAHHCRVAKLPVVILTTPDFDATTVDTSDLSQIKFGDPDLAGRVSPLRARLKDVDRDGDTDVILHFSMRDIRAEQALDNDSILGELTATALIDSTPRAIRGADSVRIVPPKGRKCLDSLAMSLVAAKPDDRDDTDAVDAAFADLDEAFLLGML